jgi:serine phosphatase RsbU (regulator of sigma subunit)
VAEQGAPSFMGHSVGRWLDAAEDASPVEVVEAVTRELAKGLDAAEISFLIADMSGRALVRLSHEPGPVQKSCADDRRAADEVAQVLPFDGGPVEQTLRDQTVRVLPPDRDGSWTVLAPVTERGEILGLLELSLRAEPATAELGEIRRTAHLLGFVIIASARHTDLYEWGRRTTAFTLPAEIQRRLLPSSFTCEAGSFTLSAWLEPAAHVGGDTFDYSLARDSLHLSITDAMGHGVDSALIATLCVGSLRNTRRQGASLLEQMAAANYALLEHTPPLSDIGFATGLVGRLDLHRAVLSLVNAGHTAPFLAREHKVIALDLPPGLPLGMFAEATYGATELPLQPGDRLVFVTDGMLERNAAALDLVTAIDRTRDLHPRETTRRLADDVLEVTGAALADDATLLVLDWHGEHARARVSQAGADFAGR